jgi:hypothetical protein
MPKMPTKIDPLGWASLKEESHTKKRPMEAMSRN